MNGFKSNTEKWIGRYLSGKNAVSVKESKKIDEAMGGRRESLCGRAVKAEEVSEGF